MIPIPGTSTVVLAAFVAGALVTYKVMDWRHDAQQLQQERVSAALAAGGVAVANKTEGAVRESVRTIYVKGATVIKEVPVYVTRKDDAACAVNTGFVRLHDGVALKGEAPGPAPDVDGRPSDVTLSRIGETVAENYTHYHACAAKLKAWQKFYRDLKALHDGSE